MNSMQRPTWPSSRLHDVLMADLGERMLREGRALAKVRHQNVVNVYAAEVHEGQVGLCMEFIKGRTLEEILKAQGPFGEGEAVTVGLKVGHALSAVHAAGIVHRDVKARNVMREDRGRIVLMDFGTGRDRAQKGAGDLAGTPLYMAPEVLAGSAATQQSDIYSVGVLLDYLVTGQYPVEGRTLDEIIQAHVRGRRKPLAERRPDLRDDFIRVIDRATAPDPDARYETAAMLVHDLVSIDVQDAGAGLAPRTVTQRVLLGGAWLGIAAIGITLIGFITSMAFNVVLERVAVSTDTPISWFRSGLQSLVAPIFNLAQIVFGVVIAVTIWKALRRLVPLFDRCRAVLGTAAIPGRRLGLWNVDSYGLIAFLCALGFFVAIVLRTRPRLRDDLGSLEHDRRSAIGAVSGSARVLLPVPRQMEWVIWAVTLASVRLVRMRTRERTPTSAALLTALLGVLVMAVIMWAIPWRLVMHSESPRMVLMASGATTWDTRGRRFCSIARMRHLRAYGAYPPKGTGPPREPASQNQFFRRADTRRSPGRGQGRPARCDVHPADSRMSCVLFVGPLRSSCSFLAARRRHPRRAGDASSWRSSVALDPSRGSAFNRPSRANGTRADRRSSSGSSRRRSR